ALARAQGALSRAERRFRHVAIGDDRRAPRLPDCFRALPKFGVGASSVSRALAKQDDEAPPLRRTGAAAVSEPYGRMRMIVFPLSRSVGLRAATASSSVATLPMLVRSRPSRTRWTTSLSWARSDSP